MNSLKTAKDLELSLLVKEAHIQQLKLKNQELLSDNMNIAELNIKLLNKINKAIEYIKQHKLDRKSNTTTRLEAFTMQERELLNILQGSDKE